MIVGALVRAGTAVKPVWVSIAAAGCGLFDLTAVIWSIRLTRLFVAGQRGQH